ncbi:hypothetical protein AB0O47_34570 [Streptomyces noursei]|uniref:Uncharacterized protein n=1 Tax=Streptomyces noursei TaxID=1971 RepID=A0A059W3U4_STRNR|nr:hypothetical protein [Streptomyces noursei]AIA03978.1 hypothetical protein DC74_3483 [Streptomyces noursei]EPY92316.1 hypothetical protein K530_53950 [Streptomyces noursei CCRC 11814]GCB91562.1 hypothetical protein SALB_04297 [Streptomyces noursei]
MSRGRHTPPRITPLRGLRVSCDGWFWGGILAVMVWGSCIAFLIMAATGQFT